MFNSNFSNMWSHVLYTVFKGDESAIQSANAQTERLLRPILQVDITYHSPLSLLSWNQRIIARKSNWCNLLFAYQMTQLTMDVTVTLLYAAHGVTQRVKSPRTVRDDQFRRQSRSTVRRGCAQTINCSRSRLIFWIGYNGVGSVVHDKI